MASIGIAEARRTFSALLASVYGDGSPLVIEKNGTPIAALVPYRDVERLERLDREQAARLALLRDMSTPFSEVSAKELEREVAFALAESRAEYRAEAVDPAQNRDSSRHRHECARFGIDQ